MKTLIIILAMPFLFACTKTELADESSESASIEGGTWLSPCGLGDSAYEIRSSSFSGGQFTQASTAYSGAGCSSALVKLDFTGSYILGGKLSPTSGSQKIDMTLATLVVTPLASSTVSSYNSMSFCGFSDWALSVGKDVVGLTCNSSAMPSLGAVSYDIYHIYAYSMPMSGVEAGMLNFGYNDSSHDGSSPAQRPESLNGNFNYSR